jgi:nitric oxide reductase large subunit
MLYANSENKEGLSEGEQTTSFSYTQQNYNNQTYFNPQYCQSNNQSFEEIKDYLIWSIINIFLFPIIGIICLFHSLKIRKFKRQGNLEEAKVYSKRLFTLNLTFTIIGVVFIILLSLMIPIFLLNPSSFTFYSSRRRVRRPFRFRG